MTNDLLFIHALSPLHAGTGQGVGVIDLPIARERATGIPYLPGSSLKGVLRGACTHEHKVGIFGPETRDASDHAGAVSFSDQALLLLPVRSMAGTFALVTSPWALQRLTREAKMLGIETPAQPKAPQDEQILLAPGSVLKCGTQVVLEDLDFKPSDSPELAQWGAWLGARLHAGDAASAQGLQQRLALVSDSLFGFLVEHATEVVARIKIEESTKTVQDGGLWYEENLPAESVLYGLVVTEATKGKGAGLDAAGTMAAVRAMVQERSFVQLGGKATVGRGLCRLIWGRA